MTIRAVVTRGYGTGSFDGTIAEVVTRGYIAGAAPPAPTPEPARDKGQDAGSGRRRNWWEGEWVIPGVTHYLPEPPPEDISPLRPKAEEARERLKALQARQAKDAQDDLRSLSARLAGITRSVGALERRAAAAVESDRLERDISSVVAKYREVDGRLAVLADEIAAIEARIEAEFREDEERFMMILIEVL